MVNFAKMLGKLVKFEISMHLIGQKDFRSLEKVTFECLMTVFYTRRCEHSYFKCHLLMKKKFDSGHQLLSKQNLQHLLMSIFVTW